MVRNALLLFCVMLAMPAAVRSSRVGSGIVRRNIEVDDDELGFVAAYELNPQKARVLFRLALLDTRSPAELQRNFAEY